MAIIIGKKEQEAALKEIKNACKEMQKINTFLEASNESGIYSISFAADNGTKCSAVAFAPDKEKVDVLVNGHKQTLRDRVAKLADDNRIMLDLKEKVIFGFDLTAEEKAELEARKTAEQEAAAEEVADAEGDPAEEAQ